MSAAPTVIAPMTTEENNKVLLPDQSWSDTFAAKIALQDFTRAENYRLANHDWRFRNADELYLGWQAQKYWEGTRYPRSSLAVFTAFQQVESILPADVKAAFGDAVPFDADPEPGTDPEEARAVRDLLLHELRMNAGEPEGAREVYRKCRKSAYIYGNGIAEMGWKYSSVKKFRYQAQFTPVTRTVFDPFQGMRAVPTGKWNRTVNKSPWEQVIDAPFLRYISIKDFYIDPNCQGPSVQMARYAAKRTLMTVDELLTFKGQEGFKIPDKSTLIDMARTKPAAMSGDVSKTAAESYRNVWWQPSMDSSADPAAARLEVIPYWTKDRCVWLINRSKVFYNEENPYGFIPFFNTFYVDVLDRFYALSISDVVEGDQRLQASLLNGRVDELALALHPDTIKRRGVNIPPSQIRRRPGLIMNAENPKEDIIRGQVQNVTQQAFMEAEAAERRTQKATGITDLSTMGTSSEGGNSANRTATGIQTQSRASGQRVEYGVENTEDTFLEPILNGMHSMNQQFLDPNKVIRILGSEGKAIHLDPLDIMNAQVKFRLRGAARMGARQALAAGLPLITQTFMNPEFLTMLGQQQQQTLNIEEMANMVLDGVGYKPRQALFRKLSPQELQAMNAPPAKDQLHKQMADDRLAAQADHLETKSMADTIRDIVKEAAKNHFAKQGEQPQLPEAPERDSVSIQGNTSVGLQVLENRGEVTSSQASALRPKVAAAERPKTTKGA